MCKRIISIVMAVITVFSGIELLSGCMAEKSSPLNMGQWLAYIADGFGMESYISDEPYISGVGKDNEYFAAFQKAVEWDIIPSDSNAKPDTPVKWQDVLVTLVNAGGFTAIDADIDEKIQYGIKHFDPSIRKYWMKRRIKQEDALILLAKATKLWANRTYDKNVVKYDYSDRYVGLPDIKSEDVMISDSIVVLNESTGTEQIKEGSIFAVPSESNPLDKTYLKAENVKKENGKVVIKTSDEEPSFDEIFGDIDIQETIYPNSYNTVFYDGNGRMLSDVTELGQTIAARQKAKATQLGYSKLDGAEEMGKISKEFTIDGVEVSLSYDTSNGINIETGIATGNLIGANDDPQKLKMNASFGVQNLSVTHKIEKKKLFSIKTAELRVNYTLTESTGVSYSATSTSVAAPPYSNGNGKFLTNFLRAVVKPKDGKGAKTIASKKVIKILSCNVYSVGVAKICLDFSVNFSFDGSVTISVTERGSKGVEYRDKKIRFIKDSDITREVAVKAKVEATIAFGPALYVIGLKKKIVGVEISVGAGAEAMLKAHLADAQMHLLEEVGFNEGSPEMLSSVGSIPISVPTEEIKKIAESRGGIFVSIEGNVKCHVDTCLDISVYFILKIGIADESYLTSLLNAEKVKLSIEVFGKKNATFLKWHIDNFDFKNTNFEGGLSAVKAAGNMCTLKYVPFDSATDDKVADEDVSKAQNDIRVGKVLMLNTMNVNMKTGQEYLISVLELPAKYKIEDIVFSSRNDKIASVSADGIIKAKEEGNTIIYAKTSDGKYKAMVAILVETSETVAFNPLKDATKA